MLQLVKGQSTVISLYPSNQYNTTIASTNNFIYIVET